VDPKTPNRAWFDVLDQSYQVLHTRAETSVGGEYELLQGVVTMMSMARRNAAVGNLFQAAHSLALCETLVQRL
jgi:hypothetical protein